MPRSAGPASAQWEQPPLDEGGRWWMPIVIGIVGLLLLGVLGYGLWLIAEADNDSGVTPTSTPAAAVTTRPPTKAPPTRTEEPTEEPARVEVPSLAGDSVEEATGQLDELGLPYRLRYETTDEEEPGTVLETQPEAGSEVDPGTRITVIVAAAPETDEPPAGDDARDAARRAGTAIEPAGHHWRRRLPTIDIPIRARIRPRIPE